ncbi:unnamed protein product [Linum tenue]|uniref:FAD-binding FR-type domain-containing protein n=1 Tax=Linum tenue TaxID=586396 RepID=A0AAV0LZ45_9ROSI|nr:unnamed protein product [Linum tenue]
MDQNLQSAGKEPLLLQPTDGENQKTNYGFLRIFAKWALRTTMWAIFVAWVGFIYLYPTQLGDSLFQKWNRLTEKSLFGITGSILLLVSGPIMAIAVLAVAHLILVSGEDEFYPRKKKYPRAQLWTFPLIVGGPLGVVSAAELIGVVLFVGYILWALYFYTLRNLALLSTFKLTSAQFSIYLMELTGLRLGMIGLFCLAFLFLPIARGSVLLRLIDIPVEHATRYHVWLGHVTMLLFTLHGLFYILEWKNIGISNLAGVISLLAGLIMWVTSLQPVRRWNFELFLYTHQLYIVFVVFLAFHVGDFIFSIAAGGIFLFMLDRFLRFCQSRNTVDVVSAKCFPCGTVELTLSKPQSLRYNALSFIFIQIRELSWLQWHPFSVSSSPLDGKYHISVLIKVLGGWTDKLKERIVTTSSADEDAEGAIIMERNSKICRKLTASVEGPYGHESPYHLMYEYLVLVAGGIGISPFMAILRDVFHRLDEGTPCLPREILLVWAVKKSEEIGLLSTISLDYLRSDIFEKLNLHIQIYVTRESDPPLEEGKVTHEASSVVSAGCSGPKGNRMSVLVGTGDNIWSGLYVISSTLGFIVLLALIDAYYINPYGISSWWYKGLLLMSCMVGGVVVFGGVVIALWHLWSRKVSSTEQFKAEPKTNGANGLHHNESSTADEDFPPSTDGAKAKDLLTASSTFINYGSRPDFQEIFQSTSKNWGHVDAGVMVCGPPTLQTTVAKEIRSHNLRRYSHDTVLHFNSHSFDL